MKLDRVNGSVAVAGESVGKAPKGRSEAPAVGMGVPRRSMMLDREEMQHDIALIERRARAMRADAVWSIARAVREWMVTGLGRPRRDARPANAARFRRTRHAV